MSIKSNFFNNKNCFYDFNSTVKFNNTIKLDNLDYLIDYNIANTLPILDKYENDLRIKLNEDYNYLITNYIEESNCLNINSKNNKQLINKSPRKTVNDRNKITIKSTINIDKATITGRKTFNNNKTYIKGILNNENIINLNKNNQVETEFSNKLNSINEFWNNIKKKYYNFIELNNVLNNNYLNYLYDNYIFVDDNINNLIKNSNFEYLNFLYKQAASFLNESWLDYISNNMKLLKSNALTNNNYYWISANLEPNNCNNILCETKDTVINKKYYKQLNTIEPNDLLNRNLNINNLIKYNYNFQSDSIIITVDLYYKNIVKDLYDILANRSNFIHKIVVRVLQRCYYVGENISPIYYVNDSDWNKDINNVFNTILSLMLKFNRISLISFLVEQDSNFDLDVKNINLLLAIFYKNKLYLEIISLNNINILSQNYFADFIVELNIIKIIMLISCNINLSEKQILNINKRFDKNSTKIISNCASQYIYIRINEDIVYLVENC